MVETLSPVFHVSGHFPFAADHLSRNTNSQFVHMEQIPDLEINQY